MDVVSCDVLQAIKAFEEAVSTMQVGGNGQEDQGRLLPAACMVLIDLLGKRPCFHGRYLPPLFWLHVLL